MGDELEKIIADAIASGITDDDTLEAIAQQWEAQQTPMPAGATAGMLAPSTPDQMDARSIFEANRGPNGMTRSAELRQEAIEHPIRTGAQILAPGVIGKAGKMVAPYVGPTLTKIGGVLEAPAAGAVVGGIEGSKRGVMGALKGAAYGAAGGTVLAPVLSKLGAKLTPAPPEPLPTPGPSPLTRLNPTPMERYPVAQDPAAIWPATATRMGQGMAPPSSIGRTPPGVMDMRALAKTAGRETEAGNAAAGAKMGELQGTPSTLQAERSALLNRLIPKPMERLPGPVGPITNPARMLPRPAIQLPPGPTPDPSFVRSVPAVDVNLGGRTALPAATTQLGSALEPSFARGVPAQYGERVGASTPVPVPPTPAPAVIAQPSAAKPKPQPKPKTEPTQPAATVTPPPSSSTAKPGEGLFTQIAKGGETIFAGSTSKTARGKSALSPNDLKADADFVKANPNATLEERLRHLTLEKAKRSASYYTEAQAKKAAREKGGK